MGCGRKELRRKEGLQPPGGAEKGFSEEVLCLLVAHAPGSPGALMAELGRVPAAVVQDGWVLREVRVTA